MRLTIKKSAAAALSAAILLSLCSCGNTPSTAETTAAQTITEATPLSIPVPVNAEGDVDMEQALAYETDFDALLKTLEAKTVDPNETVSDNTNEKTQKVFEFLLENFGKKLISGQQMSSAKCYEDILYYSVTGDLPAIKGFDFLTDGHVEMAIDWHNKSNGLVSFCWHWSVPRDIDDSESGTAFYREDITNFSLMNAVTPGTKEYEVVVHDIDEVAIQLQKLEAAGVPVIWRPLHEAGGNWFWWGKSDRETVEAQAYQKLWYMIYDRLENHFKLTNLIWLWNGQNKYMTVNPNTYDIAGIDVYPSTEDHTELATSYNTLAKIDDSGKMTTISECGYIPDDEAVFSSESTVKWLYYMPWCNEFICKATSTGFVSTDLDGTPSVNEERLSEDFLKKVYSSDNVITWSELPDWGSTTRDIPEYIGTWEFFKKKGE